MLWKHKQFETIVLSKGHPGLWLHLTEYVQEKVSAISMPNIRRQKKKKKVNPKYS